MKFLSIAGKAFKENFRDKKRLAMLLLFPLVFMLVFGFAFGVDVGENYSHEIVVFNEDQGAVLYVNNTTESRNFGDEFLEILENLTYEDSETHVFDVVSGSEEEADDMLMDREVSAVCRIEANFSEAVAVLVNSTIKETMTLALGGALLEGKNVSAENFTLPIVDSSVTSSVVVEGDLSYSEFGITQSILTSVLDTFVQQVVVISRDQTIQALPPDLRPADWEYGGTYVSSMVQPVPGTEVFKPFDYIAPGLLVFGLLIISGAVATDLAGEVEHKTLERLQISRMKSVDLLFGTLIPWAIIAAIQLIILLVVAMLIGFQWQGGPTAILIAVLIGIIAGIASVSLGLIIAAFSKSESHAGTMGPLIYVPLAFVSGSFFASEPNALMESVPWGKATLALREVLTFGEGLGDVAMSIAIIAIQTIIVFAIGVVAFSRMRLRAR